MFRCVVWQRIHFRFDSDLFTIDSVCYNAVSTKTREGETKNQWTDPCAPIPCATYHSGAGSEPSVRATTTVATEWRRALRAGAAAADAAADEENDNRGSGSGSSGSSVATTAVARTAET